MNKKFTITLLGTAIVCATMFTSSVFAATGKVTGNSVRLRKEANTKSSILETISKNTEVEVLSEEENWYKVSYNDKEGYIHKDYLKVEEQVEETTTIEESNSEDTEKSEEVQEEVIEEKVELGDKLNNDSKVYLTACYSASEIGNIAKGTKVTLEKTIGNWTYISTDEVYGWVPNYKLIKSEDTEPEEKTEEKKEEKKTDTANKINKKAYLSSNAANLRKGPGTNYDVIGGIAKYEVITVISEENGWYKVKTADGLEGYVLKSLVTIGERKTTSRSDDRVTALDLTEDKKEEEKTETKVAETKKEETTSEKTTEEKETTSTTTSADTKRKELVAYAKKYLGYKYVRGGSKPSTGFDCSGFTQYVYGHFGYKLSRTSSAQASNGTAVKKSNLKVGDLLIFTGHVGIYIGNNKFIHASNPEDGVKITSLSDSYYVKNYKGARRIIN